MDGDEDSVTAAAAPKQATLTTRSGFPKPITEMTAEEKARVDNIDLRCLSLCIGMLERVNGVGVASFSLSLYTRGADRLADIRRELDSRRHPGRFNYPGCQEKRVGTERKRAC